MRRKILWLTFLITLTFWLAGLGGCASSGGDQNYKMEGDTSAEGYPATVRNGESATAVPPSDREKPGVLGQLASGVGNLFKPKSPLDKNAVANEAPAEAQAEDTAQPAEPAPAEPAPAATVAQAEPAPVAQPAPEAPVAVVEAPAPPPAPAAPLIPPAVSDTQPSLTNGLDRSHWAPVKTGPLIGVTGHYPTYFKDYSLGAKEGSVDQGSTEERISAAFADPNARGLKSKRNGAGIFVQPVNFGIDMVLAPYRMIVKHPLTPVYEPKVDKSVEPESLDPQPAAAQEHAAAEEPAAKTEEPAPAEPAK